MTKLLRGALKSFDKTAGTFRNEASYAELLFQLRKFPECLTLSGHSLTRGVTWALLNPEMFQEAMQLKVKFSTSLDKFYKMKKKIIARRYSFFKEN